MAYTLDKAVTTWITDYRERHAFNYETIEAALNRFEAALGLGGGSSLDVPLGLEEIFDRKGVIGIGSFDFSEGVLSGPNYYLNIAAGAFWNGDSFRAKAASTNISMSGFSTGTYYVNVDTSGNPSVSATPSAESTVRQFYWDASTHTVSGKALYTGVSVLFDGDDYADMLTSAARSKNFTKVADRLEEIEQLIDPFAGYYDQDLPHSGLNFKYKAGQVRNDSVITDTPAGQVALTDDASNYVEVDPATGAVSANTTGFTSGKIPLFQVVTASGAISTVTDKRTAAIAGTGGGGGGHTQNTDVGTTSTDFTLDMDAVGSPTGLVRLIVENGDNPNAIFAYNRDTGVFEISYDGGITWSPLASVADLLADQELSKYVGLEDPQVVYSALGRDTSLDWETLDLSSYISGAPNGISAAALVVFFWDDTPSAATGINFRKGGSVIEPAYGYQIWDGQLQPHLRVIPVNSANELEFYVSASGVGTANVRLVLVGYYAKVAGVGTATRELTVSDIAVGAGATVQNNYTGWLNDGEAYYFKVDEIGGLVTETYDVAIYATDAFSEGTDQDLLIYKAEGIQPTSAFIDRLPFWCRDDDGTSELHIEITNNDGSQTGTYTFTIKAKQFS